MHNSSKKGAKTMQIQSNFSCKVIFDRQDLPKSFPISHPGKGSYSPPTEPISFMHYHNCLEIGYCYKGCGIFFIDGKVLPFSEGACSIIFENQIHIAQSDSKNPSEWKFISLDLLNLLSDLGISNMESVMHLIKRIYNSNNVFDSSHPSDISRLIYNIILELEECKENYREMVRSLVYQLVLELSRECTEFIDEGPNSKSFRTMIKISPALKYIADNYPNQFSIILLAKLCNMSMANFRKLFKSTMSISPSDYLHLVRIKMASILLINSDDSILDISIKVGYQTLSSFNRQFSKIMNMSPREWRKAES